MTNNMHACGCGATFADFNGWNNIGKIVRCQDCEEKRAELVANIAKAIEGKNVETVYVSRAVSHLLNGNDFAVEISPRKAERMNDELFQVIEA